MPSIPIQLGDLLTLAAMASKACEHMEPFMGGLLHEGQDVVVKELLEMQNDCIQVLGKLDRQNPGMIPVPHDGMMWAERAAKPGEEDEPN